MHETCDLIPGEPCLHEAFLFAVGETRSGTVELDVYQADGRLSVVTVSGFTSWKRRTDSSQSAHHVKDPVLIDCVVRQEHGVTVRCFGLELLFFGSDVMLRLETITQVDPPAPFGDAPARDYRRRYAGQFAEWRRGR